MAGSSQEPIFTGWNERHHSTPTTQAFTQSQLQFHLDPKKNVVQNQVMKPRPIVIEKLLPYPVDVAEGKEPGTVWTNFSPPLPTNPFCCLNYSNF